MNKNVIIELNKLEFIGDPLWHKLIENYKFYHFINYKKIKNNRDIQIIIRNLLFEYVFNEMYINDEITPPFILDPINSKFIKSRKANIIYTNLINTEGHIKVSKKGFEITLNKKIKHKYPTRNRTTLAHELGHTFFYDINNFPIKPLFNSNLLKNKWNIVEELSFAIGRQILVPDSILKAIPFIHEESVAKFYDLVKLFFVSKDIMARRLIHDLKMWKVYLFFTNINNTSNLPNNPANKNRFKSSNFFKHFSLNKSWKNIKDIINQAYYENGNIIMDIVQIKNNYYLVEVLCQNSSVTCLIRYV